VLEVLPMRHVTGVFLGAGIALFALLGAGWAIWRVASLRAAHLALASPRGGEAVAVLALTGIAIGLLVAVPAISPLAAGLPGLGLLAWSAWMIVSQRQADLFIPLQGSVVETGFRTLLNNGVIALFGAMMIMPLFVPSRWRRRGRGRDDGGFDGYDDGYGDYWGESPTRILE
jgi:hypothetical protein